MDKTLEINDLVTEEARNEETEAEFSFDFEELDGDRAMIPFIYVDPIHHI